MKKGLTNINNVLTMLLIIFAIFAGKLIYIAPNLSVSIALFIYSITFLITILIFNKYKSVEAKKAILSSALFILFFYLITSILCTISSHLDTKIIDDALRTIFTPNSFTINNTIIFYPHLYSIAFLIIYILSHYILIAVYDAVKTYSNIYISFGISLFIAFIIDTMLMVPLYNIKDIYNGLLTVEDIVKLLTANFMVVILTSTVMTLTYPLFIKNKKKIKG